MRHVFLYEIVSELVFAGDYRVNFVRAQRFDSFLLFFGKLLASRANTSVGKSFNISHIVVLRGIGLWMPRIMNVELIEVKMGKTIGPLYDRLLACGCVRVPPYNMCSPTETATG
jgi:hypothetical protein